MAYTAQQLITDAYYISNIVSRDLEGVSAVQLNDGLNRLNAILGIATSEMGLLPYYNSYTDNFVANQEKYYVPGLVSIETMTFNVTTNGNDLNSVRYNMLQASRDQYFGTGRANGIASLPYWYDIERLYDGADVYVYYLPQNTWPFTIWGKFQLSEVTLQTDLSVVYQRYYREYLTYKLAHFLCQYYNVVFPLVQAQQLKEYENSIRRVTPMSLTMKKMSMFQPSMPLNYGDVNMGQGWRPPS